MNTGDIRDGEVEALLGFTAEEFLSSAVRSRPIHPDDSDIAAAWLLPERQRRPDSVQFPASARGRSGFAACGENTQRTRAPGSNRARSDLQDARSLWEEPGAEQRRDFFRAMMENTDDFIFFKDRNHVMIAASRNMVTAFEEAHPGLGLLGLTGLRHFS